MYEHYEVTIDDDEVFIVAPPLEHWVPEDQTSKWHGWSRLEVRNQAGDVRSYLPLRTPELVVDLAYLAEKGIGAEVVLRWANKYGLLGFAEDDMVETKIGGASYWVRGGRRRDNVARFAEAAGEVMACLRAYEIVTN